MQFPTSRKTRVLVGACVVVAVGAIATVVQASIPDGNGVIHGCYSASGASVKNGTPLNIIDSDAGSCAKGQTPVSWGATGPPGPPGPPGAPGGLSNLFQHGNFVEVDNYAGQEIDVPLGSLPAGNYLVAATVDVDVGSSAPQNRDVFCVLGTSSGAVSHQMTVPPLQSNGNAFAELTFLEYDIVTQQTAIAIDCSVSPADGVTLVNVTARLTATEVGSIRFAD